MTETIATYQVDSLPVADLPKRYSIGKSSFYERVSALKLEFEKRGTRSIASADQIDRLDALHDHLKTRGNTIESFINSLPNPEPENSQLAIAQSDPSAVVGILASAIIQASRQADPLAHIQALQKACDHKWLLSSSELALLLKLARVSGQTIERYGFTCTRMGRNGAESAWKITQEDV